MRLSLIAAILVASAAARADVPPITSSDYNLDLFQGPVITASRVIGLAGAYVPLAEGCEGEYSNAASPSVRVPYSLGKWDWDVCLGFTNPGAFAGNDFENRGANFQTLPTRFSTSVTVNAGLELQYGPVGVTVVFDESRFGLENASVSDSVIINRVTGSISNAFLDDQLLLGVGFRTATFDADRNGQTILTSGGASTQFGAILKPKRTPVRLGATLRTELDALEELQKKYAKLWSRHEVLLLVGLLVTGNATNAVGISDFLAQRLIHSGENIVVSPRLALETEVVPNWLMVRGGTYLEPARYADAFSREHFTLGVDVRLFKFNPWGLLGEDPWRIRLAADLSARYFNYGISLGKYH